MKPFFIILLFATSLLAQPWSPEVIWDRSGLEDSSLYGYSILPLGDQNDDGFDDWAVFAYGSYPTSTGDSAYVEFFHGGNPPSTIPYATIRQADTMRIVRQVETAGDLNDDGYQDWFLVGMYGHPADHGIVHVFFGGPDADLIPDVEILIQLGGWTTALGDFNGDGFDDIYVYEEYQFFGHAFFGGSPMDTVPDWTKHDLPSEGQIALPQAYGDLNGDGYSDFVSAKFSSNTTYIFLGGTNPDTVPAYTWPNMQHWPLSIVNDLNGDRYSELVYLNCNVHYGAPQMSEIPSIQMSFPCAEGNAHVAASLGDINRDGYNDLALVREYCSGSWWGVLSLYLGQPALNSQPNWTIYGRGWQNLISIGTAAGLGDVNRDGIDDFAIGAWDDLDQEGWRGRCIVVAGDTSLRVDTDEPFIPHPSSFSLLVYPNPFNATTTLSFSLSHTSPVSLTVFNLLGQAVYQDDLGVLNAGEHSHLFDASELPSGVYLARVQAGEHSQMRKMVLLK
ncbi:MAG: T9SS type A sorting domain-containing protein [Calditrichota bacterium]